MRYIAGSVPENKQFLSEWMEARLYDFTISDPASATFMYQLNVKEDGTSELLNVVAMTHWCASSVQLHVASDGTKRWATWRFFHELFNYIFITSQRCRFNVLVHANNNESLELQKRLGLTQVGVLKDEFGYGEDGILWGMTLDEYRNSKWFKKPITRSAA
jgi:hypothetical protein